MAIIEKSRHLGQWWVCGLIWVSFAGSVWAAEREESVVQIQRDRLAYFRLEPGASLRIGSAWLKKASEPLMVVRTIPEGKQILKKVTVTESKGQRWVRATLRNPFSSRVYVEVKLMSLDRCLFQGSDRFDQKVYRKANVLERLRFWKNTIGVFQWGAKAFGRPLSSQDRVRLVFLRRRASRTGRCGKVLTAPDVLIWGIQSQARYRALERVADRYGCGEAFLFDFSDVLITEWDMKLRIDTLVSLGVWDADGERRELNKVLDKRLEETWLAGMIRGEYRTLSVEAKRFVRVNFIRYRMANSAQIRKHLSRSAVRIRNAVRLGSGVPEGFEEYRQSQRALTGVLDDFVDILSRESSDPEQRALYYLIAHMYDTVLFERNDPLIDDRHEDMDRLARTSLGEQYARLMVSDGMLEAGEALMYRMLHRSFGPDLSPGRMVRSVARRPKKLGLLLGIAFGFGAYIASQYWSGPIIAFPPVTVSEWRGGKINLQVYWVDSGRIGRNVKNPVPFMWSFHLEF